MIVIGPNLDKEKEIALQKIADQIGELRKQHITVIYGQDMLYTAKYEEARDYISDPMSAQPGDYPLLEAEVGVTAPDVTGVAQTILNLRDQWKTLSGPMEALRISTSDVIRAATSRAEINAAMTGFETTLSSQ